MNKANKKVILQDVKCSYVYLNKTNKNGKYSVQPLIEKGSANYKKIMQAQKEVLIEAFGEKAWKTKGKYKLAVRDGDADIENGGEPKEEEHYRDVVFLNVNNDKKPGVVNRRNEPATDEDIESYGYSGCYFHVSVNLYSFDSKKDDANKPGIGAGLVNVMLRKEGDRLDGSVSAVDEFSEFAEDDEIDSSDEWDDELGF